MWVDLLITLGKIFLIFFAILNGVMVMTYVERRGAGFIQDRLGPNRVGPKGLLQPIADGLKFFMKEDLIPSQVDKLLFLLAPMVIFIPAFMTFAVIPFGKSLEIAGKVITLQIADINVGLLYILALTSLGIFGIVIGGWASNSKYPLLGGLRLSAQMISYEISLGLSVLGVLIIAGSLKLGDIVSVQQGSFFHWNVFRQPLGFLVFLVAMFAETNRLPFDLTEAEQELVGGYHTEYSSMKFAMFFMSEYANMVTASGFIATLFFGGWDIPFWNEAASTLPGWLVSLFTVICFVVKVSLILWFYVWVRWTFPRFRYDQLMSFGWKVLLPIALFNLLVTATYITIQGM